ncbi:MAG: trypsin-like serine protease [Clostridiales bacterium]|nr:trypsin-like serine protease [Clostridiales bacterium]
MDDDKTYQGSNNEPNFVIVENQGKYEKKKKRGNGRKVLSIILVIIIGAVSGFGGGLAALYYGIDLLDFPIEQSQINITTQSHIDTAEAVAKKVIPSVVGISTTTEVIRENILGMRRGELVEGVGTGFIVHKDGYILTNSHVIGDGSARNITVQLTDRREMEGRVLWNDTTLDLAIVKIDATNLIPVELGDSDEVNIGAYAVAIGNPFGLDFDRSVTQGVISGLDRTITVGNNTQQATMEGLMQTDASINSGNSGGPLLNSKGEVIGINTAKAATGEGLGFAIPINTAKPIIKEVMETGTFKKAYIGIGGADVELYLQYFPQDDFGTETGVYISKIYEGSPADNAGLRIGDAIVAIDDIEIKTMEQLTRELFSFKPGDVVNITFYRNGKMMKAELKFGVLDN